MAVFLSAAVLLLDRSGRAATSDVKADPDRIVSALRREKTVLASTSGGLYEATLGDRVWRKIETPPGMSPGGILIQQDAKSPLLGYYHPYKVEYPTKSGQPFTTTPSDLFVSEDGGETWRLTSQGRRFARIDFHPDGALYTLEESDPHAKAEAAVGSQSFKIMFGTRRPIVRSSDLGKTWQDITGDLSACCQASGFIIDPVHPERLIVESGYALGSSGMYEGDGKGHWKEVNEYWLPGALMNRELLESGWQIGRGKAYQTPRVLRLSDYFRDSSRVGDADDSREWPWAFRLEMEKTAFTFRKRAPMSIPVRIVFLADHQQAPLLDHKNDLSDWRVAMVDYAKDPAFDLGRRPTQATGTPMPQGLAGNPGMVQVDRDHPYEREVDLRGLHDFSKPGIYRLLLYHTDADMPAGGAIGSPVLDITIID